MTIREAIDLSAKLTNEVPGEGDPIEKVRAVFSAHGIDHDEARAAIISYYHEQMTSYISLPELITGFMVGYLAHTLQEKERQDEVPRM